MKNSPVHILEDNPADLIYFAQVKTIKELAENV